MILAFQCLWLLAQAPAAVPPRPAEGTAVVRGKVIEKPSGAPLERAVVSIRAVRGGGDVTQVYTNQYGVFEFTKLAAGPYELRAAAGEYRATHVPSTYPTAAGGTGPPLQLKDGEQRTDIVISLSRALAISGRVIDEDGNPLANIEVSVPNPQDGMMMSGFEGRPRTTDDRGMFRLHGLAAGRYVLCATPRRGPSFDLERPRRLQYVQTCYPSVTDVTDATEVTLADQDVAGLEIRLQRRPTYVLSGHVIGADGTPPENVQVSLMRIEGNSSSGSGTGLRSGGAFTISNVTPGAYELSARLGRDRYSSRPDDRESQWGGVRLEVTTADVVGLVVQLKAAATLKGTVAFEDPPEKPGTTPMAVAPQPLNSPGANRPFPAPATVGDDRAFELRGLFGPLVLRIFNGMPPGYSLKSIRYRGRDITDTAVEFDGDPAHPVEVLLTSRTAALSGQVMDESGAPVAGAWVIPFPADPARWKGFQGPRSRTSEQGRYRLPQLVAGEYFVAAVSAADQRLLNLPDDYDRLAAVAERITVLERERRTADLRVNTVPLRKKQP